MKILLPIINGLILSQIAASQGYHLNDWQWWAWVVLGTIYVISYNDLEKL